MSATTPSLPPAPIYQTSHSSADWREDPLDQHMRGGLDVNDKHDLKRKLFPLIGRVKVASPTHPAIVAGTILYYCRTKLAPSIYPIEGLLIVTREGSRQTLQPTGFTSDEVELTGLGS